MPDQTNTPGQETPQPAGGQSTSASSGTGTVLGGDGAAPSKPPEGQQQQQGDAAKGAAPKAGEQAKGEQPKAIEKYADFKVPDGVTVDTGMLTAISPVLLKHKLTQEAAQELVDVYASRMQAASTEFETQLKNEEFAVAQAGELLGQQREQWAAALKSDQEIGGKDFDTNVKTAQKALARFGSPQLKQLFETTGLGNHPEFVRFFLKVGRAISEDNTTLGGGDGGGRKSTEDVFYSGAAS